MDAPSAGYMTLIGIGFLASVVGNIAAVVALFVRKPPLPEEMAKTYATKAEVHALRVELQGCIGSVQQQLRSGEKAFKDIERVLGRVEGLLERCPYVCQLTPTRREG